MMMIMVIFQNKLLTPLPFALSPGIFLRTVLEVTLLIIAFLAVVGVAGERTNERTRRIQ